MTVLKAIVLMPRRCLVFSLSVSEINNFVTREESIGKVEISSWLAEDSEGESRSVSSSEDNVPRSGYDAQPFFQG